jgi:IMP cyclohydrolase
MLDPRQIASDNLKALCANPYTGRGIVVGLDETDTHLVQAYWITGRSENSRNRIFVADDKGSLRTQAADPSKVKDPSLIIYRVMAEIDGLYVVSNGDQTDTVIEADEEGEDLYIAMLTRTYEPDAPNYTPRITALCSLREISPYAEISMLRRSKLGEGCDRHFWRYEQFQPGLGYGITTYTGDGDPLPAFQGEPYLLPLLGGIERMALLLWDALDSKNRVSLAVKMINIEQMTSRIHIINQYTKKAD